MNKYPSLIIIKRELRASPESAWDLLTDTTKWRWWGPTVRSVTCSDRYIRKGSWGKVCTPIGLWVPFLITKYEHENYRTWKVAGIQATGHRLIPFNTNSCIVAFELPLFWLPYVIVCRIALKRMARMITSTISSTVNTLSTTIFAVITDFFRTSASSANVIMTDASTSDVLCTLLSGELSKQYRQFELLKSPTQSGTIAYRFYMKPTPLVENYDVTMLPEEYDNILVYKALLSMQGFIRSTNNEVAYWTEQLQKLERNCKSQYTQTRSAGGRPKYVQYRPRF